MTNRSTGGPRSVNKFPKEGPSLRGEEAARAWREPFLFARGLVYARGLAAAPNPMQDTDPGEDDVTEAERMRGAWEVYLYARDLLAKRMSYGMVAQSMLLVSFSTLATGRGEGSLQVAYIQWTVGALGLFYTVYQLLRVHVIQKRLRYIENAYFRGKDLVFSEFLDFPDRSLLSRDFSQIAIILVFMAAWMTLTAAATLAPAC